MTSLLGLKNFGNSCYHNAVFQALVSLPDVRRYFLAFEPTDLLPMAPSWIQLLAQTVVSYHRQDRTQLDRYYRKYQRELAKTGLFSSCQQEDASELLQVWLDQLVKWSNYPAGQFDLNVWPQIHPLVKHFTFLTVETELITTQPVRQPPLNSRNEQKIRNVIFPSQICRLSLPPETRDVSLTSLLADVNYLVSTIPGRAQAKTFHQCPKYLILVLGREQYDAQRHQIVKNYSSVKMPESYNFRQLFPDDHPDQLDYRLVARVNHHGQSLTSGHYTADIVDHVTNIWYHCDDQQITLLRQFNSSSPDGLIFIYQSTNQPARLDERKLTLDQSTQDLSESTTSTPQWLFGETLTRQMRDDVSDAASDDNQIISDLEDSQSVATSLNLDELLSGYSRPKPTPYRDFGETDF